MNHGKHYVDSAKLIDRTKTYEPQEALELCCKTAKAKFDETVELHVRLGVDSRHADQQVRGAVVLPNGTGKNVRVVARLAPLPPTLARLLPMPKPVRSSTAWTSRTSSMFPLARLLLALKS